jgi:hypothetical protein
MQNFDNIISIGFNCGTTHLAQLFKNYKRCSPFDWVISSPISSQKIINSLYVNNIDDIIDKIKFDQNNNIIEYDICAPHYSEDEYKDKLKRRLTTLYESLNNVEINILFLYVALCSAENCIDHNEIIKISKIINLFRPKDTYKIIFIENHIVYNEQNKNILFENNIDYIKVEKVQEERFWIFPCLHAIKNKYTNLEFHRTE